MTRAKTADSTAGTGMVAMLVPVMLSIAGCAAKLVSPNLDPLRAATAGEWSFDLDGNGRSDCHEVDVDGDGVVDRFRFDLNGDGAFDLVTDRAVDGSTDSLPALALFVDGVSIGDVAEMWAHGYFREFHRPGAMISPFPSMTYVSFSQMLGTPPPRGYEELYYDIERDALAGGVSEHLSAEEDGESAQAQGETFLSQVGYKQPATYSGLVYVLPSYTMRKDLENVIEYLDSAAPGPAVAYVGTADGIAHKLGPSGTRELLIELDRILRELILRSHGRLRVLMASDHGNSYIRCRRIALEQRLRPFGFQVAETLGDSAAVVIPAFGLVGFAAAYLAQERVPEFARAAVRISGVEHAIYGQNGVAHVLAAKGRGEARISFAADPNRYRYEPIGASDPLDLRYVMATLDQDGKCDAGGFIRDEDWFAATKDHTYPDAVRRVYEAAAGNVANKAPVLLSFDDSTYFGSNVFDAIVDLAGTHGNLRRASTLGFILSNDTPPPDALRSWDVRAAFPRVPFGPLQ
jgi:hypothetical protein